MELISKFRDAASMLWMNLDAQEKQIVIYALLWFVSMMLHNLRLARVEKLRRELREGGSSAAHGAVV